MTPKIRCALVLVGIVATTGRAAAQEQAGYAANHFNPSERGSRWFALDSLEIEGDGRLALGVVNDLSYRPLVHYASDGDADNSIIRNQYVMHAGGSAVLGNRVRLAIDVPIQLFADGHTTVIQGITHRPAEDVAVGDVRLSADVRLVGSSTGPGALALGASLFAPSGSPSAYTGDGKPRVEPRIAFAGRVSSFAYAAKLGAMLRGRDESFGDGAIGHALTAGLSAGVLLADGKVLLGPELFGEQGLTGGSKVTPIEAILGLHANVASDVRVGLGGGVGLNRDYGAPVARGLLSLEWVPGDAAPEAPKAAPPPPPPEKECPEPPPAPAPVAVEVGDRDHDGIVDKADACPDEAGVGSSDSKTNGCPDTDRDKDGVPNDTDSCPDEAGKPDADPKKNGCPKAFLLGSTIRILEQVKFKTGSAELVAGKDSQDILSAVQAVLVAHPEVKSLRIEGHTDDRGNAAKNKALSQARADSVMKWLTAHGIEKTRLTAVGFGSEKAIDDNATEAGRTNNRRVEFHVEQGSER
jgi:OOP family OmpA-OmpF porin